VLADESSIVVATRARRAPGADSARACSPGAPSRRRWCGLTASNRPPGNRCRGNGSDRRRSPSAPGDSPRVTASRRPPAGPAVRAHGWPGLPPRSQGRSDLAGAGLRRSCVTAVCWMRSKPFVASAVGGTSAISRYTLCGCGSPSNDSPVSTWFLVKAGCRSGWR